jgi:conjugal transfer pilus assembly protein TraW
MRSLVLSLSVFLLCTTAYGKDLSVYGHTFEIHEPDLLKQLEGKLAALEQNGKLAPYNEALVKKAQQRLQRPESVQGITKAKSAREFNYDPSITVPYDLKDHQGKVFHSAGTRVNPLQFHSLTHFLVFINGDDPLQVAWVQANYSTAKIILVQGSPFDLMEQWDKPIYFDQGGKLTTKLGVKHVPAIVKQEGLMLKVSEIVLKEEPQ